MGHRAGCCASEAPDEALSLDFMVESEGFGWAWVCGVQKASATDSGRVQGLSSGDREGPGHPEREQQLIFGGECSRQRDPPCKGPEVGYGSVWRHSEEAVRLSRVGEGQGPAVGASVQGSLAFTPSEVGTWAWHVQGSEPTPAHAAHGPCVIACQRR